jgi:hypothetical protein
MRSDESENVFSIRKCYRSMLALTIHSDAVWCRQGRNVSVATGTTRSVGTCSERHTDVAGGGENEGGGANEESATTRETP